MIIYSTFYRQYQFKQVVLQMPNNIGFGVFFPCYTFRNEKNGTQLFNRLQESVQECEEHGYASVWLDDHLMLHNMPILESWINLSALSQQTKTIRIGTMVTCNSFRNPSLLAKMAATLDNISNGRLELGIGAGVQEKEHISYGYPFLSPKNRIERLNEAIEIIKILWTEEKASYNRKHYQIRDAVCEPKPVQKPHPPIIIGGEGEQLTLKVTAQHANRLDWGYVPSLEEYNRKLKVLENHCKSVGRSFGEIEKSCWPAGQIFIGENKKQLKEQALKCVPEGVCWEEFIKTSFVCNPKECVKLLRQYVDIGVTYFMLYFGDFPNLDGLRLFAKKVIPEVES
jgi:F420-dependent oxidoreductase-like protein